jgi:MFS family permease
MEQKQIQINEVNSINNIKNEIEIQKQKDDLDKELTIIELQDLRNDIFSNEELEDDNFNINENKITELLKNSYINTLKENENKTNESEFLFLKNKNKEKEKEKEKSKETDTDIDNYNHNKNEINNSLNNYDYDFSYNQTETFNIDKHLDKIGYSFYHYRIILIVTLVLFVDGCEMSNVNMLLSSIQQDLNLDTFQKSSLSSSIFIGFFIGSFLSGFTTNKYGRLKPIKYGVIFIFIFSFLTGISKSISQLIIMRILSGLAIGTVVPACKTLITECIPSTNRSFVLSIIWLLYPFGTVYICVIALNSVDAFDSNLFNWRKVFVINSLNSFLLIILTQTLTESPRYLLKNGKYQEAIELIDYIGSSSKSAKEKLDLTDSEKNAIYVECQMTRGGYENESGPEFSALSPEELFDNEKLNLNKNNNKNDKKKNKNKNSDSDSIYNSNSNSINFNIKKFESINNNKRNDDNNKINNYQEVYIDDKYKKEKEGKNFNLNININKTCALGNININIQKIKTNLNKNKGVLQQLFSKKFISTSLLLSFIWFSTSFVSFGLLYSLPKLFEKVANNNKQDSMRKMLKTMILVSPSAILRGFIADLEFLGRRNTLALGFFGAFINSIICYFSSSNLTLLSGLLKFSIHISSGTVSIYTSEVYPTEIRSLAIGFGTSLTRLGAFLSSFSCELFDNLSPKGSFLLFGITCFFSFVFSLSLKYETLGKPLDFTNDYSEDNYSDLDYDVENKIEIDNDNQNDDQNKNKNENPNIKKIKKIDNENIKDNNEIDNNKLFDLKSII